MLHLRLNNSLYNDVKKLAKSMGVSVSLIGEVLFKHFIEEKELNISTFYTPNKNLKHILDKAKKIGIIRSTGLFVIRQVL